MSHAFAPCPYAGSVKVREPVERPLDVVAIELLLSASQAYVAGTLMYLAVGLWADRGVGLGPVAFILGGLSLAVGAAWLFWLLGGTGWPLAAANVPVAMFAGVALVLGTTADGLIRLEPLPLMLLIAASIYGIVGGVFVDSPRRWRWDQRQRLRPGTKVPRVSPTTRSLVAMVPRTIPSRSTATEPGWPEPPGTGAELDETPMPADAETVPGTIVLASDTSIGEDAPTIEPDPDEPDPDGAEATEAVPSPEDVHRSELDEILADVTVDNGPLDEAPKPARTATSIGIESEGGGIELPTSLEPKSQRSPWAWAAPPDWTREEDESLADTAPERDK